MSRFALLLAEQEASCYLPDKEFRSSLLLTDRIGLDWRTIHQRAGHFCRPLHVAMENGLSLRLTRRRLAYSL
jgi:hypothetical protein